MSARFFQSLKSRLAALGRIVEARLVPPLEKLPAEKQRRARLSNWCLLVMAVMLLFWVVANLAIGAWLLAVWLGGGLVATLALLGLLRMGLSVILAVHLNCLLMVSIILVSAVYSGGLTAAMFTLFAVIPVGAVTAAGLPGALWLIPTIGSVLVLHLFESQGHEFAFLTPPAQRPLDAALTWATSAVIVTLLIFYYEVARRRTEGEMIEAMLQAEEVSRLKTRFVSCFSHEVRTPLHGILGMLALMQEESSVAVRKKLAQEARQAGEALLSIISEVLEISRTGEQRMATLPGFRPRGEPRPPASAGGGGGKRVLVVEDDAVGRLLLKTLLERMGYSVDEASSGQEALGLFERGGYRMIFMDCGLPDLDGEEITRRLRRREQELGAARVPVVAVSAQATAEQKERCCTAGMDDFLSKPFGRDELALMIKRWQG